MKKLFSAILSVLLALALCGCDFTEPDRRYIAAALGFDAVGDALSLSVEAVVINSESTEEDIKTEVFSSAGKTPEECFYNLAATLPKNLTLTHCGIIAVGEGISKEQLLKIIAFCRDRRDINLSSYIVAVRSAEALLSLEATSALAVGYEVMSAIEQSSNKTGVMYSSRIYEIENALTAVSPAFMLARFEVEDKKLSLVGSRICLEGEPVLDLDVHDTAVCALMRNENRGGSIAAGGRVYRVESPYTYFDAEKVGENIEITVDIRVSDAEKSACRDIEDTARRLFLAANGDIFGFADRIYAKHPSIWRSISDDPQTAVKGAVFNVSCETGKRKDEA